MGSKTRHVRARNEMARAQHLDAQLLLVGCPRCGVGVGEHCVRDRHRIGGLKTVLFGVHVERSIEAEKAALDALALLPAPPKPRQR